MAEVSGFFNSYNKDRRYYVSFMAEYFSSFVGNGIFFGGNYLKVEPFGGNMDIKVLVGKAWINGYYYANKDAPKVLTVETSHLTLPRIDAVVLRCDLRESNRTITAEIKKGVPANTPLCPELQRDDAMYELKLAEVRVNANVTEVFAANITDYRLNSEMCGVVTNNVPNGFTFDDMFNQYTSQLELRMAAWDSTKVSQEGQWGAQMSTQQNSWQTQTSTQQNEFDTQQSAFQGWFDGAKNNITTLQSFYFQNWSELNGCKYKEHPKNAEGKYITTINATADDKLIARQTEWQEAIAGVTCYMLKQEVFDTDGITVIKEKTKKEYKDAATGIYISEVI